LNRKFGYGIGISPSALRMAGQEHKRNSNYDEAISIFKYAIEKHPDNAFAYVSLGQAYEENSQLELAKEAYEKGYNIALSTSHPQVKWVRNFLDRILQKIDKEK
jgi:tetratricopeptide (TPR) repeat protein